MKKILLLFLVLFTVSVGYSAVLKPVCKEKTKIEFKKSDLQFEKVAVAKVDFIVARNSVVKEKEKVVPEKVQSLLIEEDIFEDKDLRFSYRENLNNEYWQYHNNFRIYFARLNI